MTLGIDLSSTANLPDPDALDPAAAQLANRILRFEQAITDVQREWRALSGNYVAPEQDRVLNALDDPLEQSGSLSASGASAAAALEDFAAAVRIIRSQRAILVTDIQALETLLASSDTLLSNGRQPIPAALSPNSAIGLRIRAKSLSTDYATARSACVTALGRIRRSSVDASSFYAAGTLDLSSREAEILRKAVMEPHATSWDFKNYLALLARMAPGELSTFAAENPAAGLYPPRAALGAADQMEFWSSLSTEQKSAMMLSLPALVGNLQGVPYVQRSAANLKVLNTLISGTMHSTPDQRKAYLAIRDSFQTAGSSAPPRFLMSFDATGDKPLAGIAIGDLDTADTVLFNASGMGSGTHGMVGEVDNAQVIWDQQAQHPSGGSHAVVSWIGYDSPEMAPSTEVNSIAKARTGGTAFAATLDGLHLTRKAEGRVASLPRVSVSAHSYGTTMAAYALTDISYPVDAVIFYGSAGIDPAAASHASDFQVKTDAMNQPEVYVTHAHGDNVAPTGIKLSPLGHVSRIDPGSADFGAKVYESGQSTGADGQVYQATTGHSGRGDFLPGSFTPVADPVSMVGKAIWNLYGGIYPTEIGHGYLDPGTTNVRYLSDIAMGDIDGLEFRPQPEPMFLDPEKLIIASGPQ